MAHFHELKQEMNSSREAERNNLTTLTLQSDTAMKELQKKKEKVNDHTNERYIEGVVTIE